MRSLFLDGVQVSLETPSFFNAPPAVRNVADGGLQAQVDLPAYLSSELAEDHGVSSSSSFCLLQVSADLSTAVAVTRSHAAAAVDLNHYFRYFSTGNDPE